MKKLILLITILMTASMQVVFAAAHEETLDKIVAVVNDDVITQSEFDRMLSTMKTQLSQQNIPTPSDEVLKKQVLTQLINNKLQVQIGKQAGAQPTDKEVDSAIQHIAQQNNISVDTLYDSIHQEGMKTEDYRQQIKDQMTMQRLQQQEIAGKMSVSPQEVTAYIKSHPLQMDATKEYRIQDILVPLKDTPSTEDVQKAKAHADDLIKQVNAGADFNKLAQSESGNSNALEGGDLGFRQLPEIPSAFAEIVSKMKPQTIAGPIQTPNGFHIIRLSDVRAAAGKSTAPDRKQIEEYLLQQKFAEAVQNWVSKLKAQAFIVMNPTNDATHLNHTG